MAMEPQYLSGNLQERIAKENLSENQHLELKRTNNLPDQNFHLLTMDILLQIPAMNLRPLDIHRQNLNFLPQFLRIPHQMVDYHPQTLGTHLQSLVLLKTIHQRKVEKNQEDEEIKVDKTYKIPLLH